MAALALAWLGLMERDRRLLDGAVALSGRVELPADVARAERQLLASRRLNPDTAPELARSALYLGNGRPDRAATVLRQVVRSEPDNLLAWGRLYQLVRRTDPATAREALVNYRRLDPVGARRR